jgi:hypothetical protein
MKQTQNQFYGKLVDLPSRMDAGSIYFCTDSNAVYLVGPDRIPRNILINSDGENVLTLHQRAEKYSLLEDGEVLGALVYVSEPEGSQWLPGTMGGAYYPAGWYIWNGTNWISDRNSIAKQFQTNVDQLDLKVDKVGGYTLTENDLTNALKTAYDSAVTWISTNGTNLIAHLTVTNNPHSVTKTQVGLGNVDNTSDLSKPLSNAAITESATKVDKVTGERLINASEIILLGNTTGTNTGDQNIIFEVQDEGLLVNASISKLNFVGAGITATDSGSGVAEITVSAAGGGSALTVEDEGTSLSTAVTKFNFVGTGVTVTEPVADEMTVTITGGGGAAHTVTNYRSSYESSDGEIYDGYLLDTVITITREIDGVTETATGLTDLETDWTNRLNLIYI